jgi:hypothetical protein
MSTTLPLSDSASPLLLTQKQAAALVQVSQAYLRASDCPKVLLRGNGGTTKPLVRYRRQDLERWIDGRRIAAIVPSRRSA